MADATTVLSEFIRAAQKGKENALDIVRETLPDGKDKITLAIQNRELQPEPVNPPQRRESPRRAHTFHDVEGFSDYLAKYKTANTVVLADVPSQRIYAVLNEKAADGFEMLSLQPAMHPLFKPWDGLLREGMMAIPDFAEFIMLNRRAVVAPDARELVLTLSQVRASKSITIERGRGMKSINGFMVETTIQGQSQKDYIDMPDAITLAVPLFVRTSPRQIEVDLLAVAEGTEIYMRARSSDVDQAKVQAFEEMCTAVRQIPEIIVGFGRPDHLNWDYLSR